MTEVTEDCAVGDCMRPRVSRGWCSKHYQRWKRTGDPEKIVAIRRPDHCTVESCTRPVAGNGLCGAHYRRNQVHGDPLGGGPDRPRAPETCAADGCDRKPVGLGLCNPHYKAHRLASDPEYRERKNAAWHIWAVGNADYLREQWKAYREANPERRREMMAKWRAEHPAASAASGFQRRRRRAGLPDDVAEMVEPAQIFKRDNGICRICDEPVDPAIPWPDPMSATMDHIIPVSDPLSTHTYDNMALAHWDCNRRKGVAAA